MTKRFVAIQYIRYWLRYTYHFSLQCDVQPDVTVPDNGTTVLLGTAFGNYLDIRTTDGAIICRYIYITEHMGNTKF